MKGDALNDLGLAAWPEATPLTRHLLLNIYMIYLGHLHFLEIWLQCILQA